MRYIKGIGMVSEQEEEDLAIAKKDEALYQKEQEEELRQVVLGDIEALGKALQAEKANPAIIECFRDLYRQCKAARFPDKVEIRFQGKAVSWLGSVVPSLQRREL